LKRLRHAQAATVEQGRRGRRLVDASAHSGELPDRLAGIEETRAAVRLALVLAPRIEDTEQDVENLREDFLAKRVERRQAKTLVEEAGAQDALASERRSQQALDEWFCIRRPRKQMIGTCAKELERKSIQQTLGAVNLECAVPFLTML
jgi:hypothetical protein